MFMKRLLPEILVILFPYSIVFLIYSVTNSSVMESLFDNNIYLGLLYLCVFWMAAFISAVLVCVRNISQKRDPMELAWTNMIIKLVHIPAYLFIFVVGLICVITIFTIPVSICLAILDCAAIVLSGLAGASAVKRCHEEGALSAGEAVAFGILQFVFCADVVISVVVFVKAKNRRAG